MSLLLHNHTVIFPRIYLQTRSNADSPGGLITKQFLKQFHGKVIETLNLNLARLGAMGD